MTIPVFDATPETVPPDEHSRRIHDGAKVGRTAVARDLLNQQVRQLERMLPPPKPKLRTPPATGRPNRASAPLTDTERRFVSPHTHTAAGARNSAADQLLVQKAHDALSRLGATCRNGSANDEVANPPIADVVRRLRP
jgi:hypothetical protein